MPTYKSQSGAFSAGELSPEAQDRIDSPIWRAGAEVLDNLLVRRGGGVRTRPGFRIVEDDEGQVSAPEVKHFPVFTPETSTRRFPGKDLTGTPRTIAGQPEPTTVVDGSAIAFYGATRHVLGVPGEGGLLIGSQPAEETAWPLILPGTGYDTRQKAQAEVLAKSGMNSARIGGAYANVWRAAALSDLTLDQQRIRMAMPRAVFIPKDGWPIRRITLRRVSARGSISRRAEDAQANASWYQLDAATDPTTNDAPNGRYWPKFAIFGRLDRLTGWYPLTDLGPWDTLAEMEAARDARTALVTERDERHDVPLELIPDPSLAGPSLNAWFMDEGRLVSAYLRLAIFELGCHLTIRGDRTSPNRASQFRSPASACYTGHNRLSIQGVEATYSTDDNGRPQGAKATAAADAVRVDPAAALNPSAADIRLVEWQPTQGVSLIVQMTEQGARIFEVRGQGESLINRTAAPGTTDGGGLPLALPSGILQDAVFVAAEDALYVFHEDLHPPKVIRRDERGVFTAGDFIIPDANVPKGPAPDNVPYWGPGNGIRSGFIAYGRMGLIGSRRHPNMLAFSIVGDYTQYNPISDAPDQPFHALTSGMESLHAAIQGRRVILFGERGEYFLPSETLAGQTLAFRRTSAHGSPRGGRALNVGDAVVFRQAGPDGRGTDMRMMVYSDEETGFRSPSLAPFSSHLVQDVVAYAWQEGSEADGSGRLWCVRPGGVSVLTMDRGAQVNAWSRITPPAGVTVFDVASIANRVFLLCGIAGAPVMVELSHAPGAGSVLDLAEPKVWGPAQDLDSHADIPNGAELTVVSDRDPPFTFRKGEVLDPSTYTLTPGARVEVGLPVQWTLRTLPHVVPSATGTSISVQKSRIVRTMVDFEDTAPGDFTLAVQRLQQEEVFQPGRWSWPRRIEIEDSRGLWLPFITIPSADTERLVRCKLGARRGWRNRTALALRGQTPVSLVGLSYKVAGGG